jgi:hypothetical protein
MLTILSDFRAKPGVANPQEEARMNACPPQEQPWCSTNVPKFKPGASQENQAIRSDFQSAQLDIFSIGRVYWKIRVGTFSLNPVQHCVPEGD